MRHDRDDYDDRPLRRSSACQCFAPGECAGSCPGPDNCPMCEEDDDEAESHEDAEDD